MAREPEWVEAHEPIAQLAAHECIVSSEGRLVCADLGETRPASKLGEPIVQFEANSGFARCALLRSGEVSCWGCTTPQYETREIRDLWQAKPKLLSMPAVRQIAIGGFGMCALMRTGDVWCWGARGYDENQICQGFGVEPPVTFTGGISQIAMSGEDTLCRMDIRGDVRCAFVNDRGLLPVIISRVTRVVGGGKHFCAITQTGSVVCWGDNEYAQSGAPSAACKTEETSPGYVVSRCKVAPHRVPLPEPAIDVSAGPKHTCAVLRDGRVFCWGSDPEAELGFVSNTRCPVPENGICAVEPRAVPGINDAIRVLASKRRLRTWALLSDGSAVAWPPDKKRP